MQTYVIRRLLALLPPYAERAHAGSTFNSTIFFAPPEPPFASLVNTANNSRGPSLRDC